MEKQMENIKNIYCSSMYKSCHVDVDGYITPCCLFIHDVDKKTRITDVDHIEVVLLDEFEEYREQMRQGIWPDGCNQCKFAEEEDRSSKRLQDLDWMNHNVKTGPEIVSLEYLQLKTGRLCNLECTICGPWCSTSIASTQLKNGEITREYYDKLQKEIAWSEDLSEYQKMNANYVRIDIAGGEPLMNKTHFKWLNQLEETSDTQLLYNTNGTFKPNQNEIDIWERFGGIWITFSIDSYEEKFEKLRVNAKWVNVLDNMKFITEEVCKKFKEHQPQTESMAIMTIHEENVMDIIELHEKLTENIDFIQQEPLNLNYLFYPEQRAIHNMSAERLDESIKYYENNIHRLKEGRLKNDVIHLINSMRTFIGDKIVAHNRPADG